MGSVINQRRERLPWYIRPFYFPIALSMVLIMTVLSGPFVLLTSLYFMIYPERHVHIYDCHGNERQTLLLAKLRSRYGQLTIWQRIGRGYILWCRYRQRKKLPDPRHENRTLREAAEQTRRNLKEKEQQ